jgi:hypothetical protein
MNFTEKKYGEFYVRCRGEIITFDVHPMVAFCLDANVIVMLWLSGWHI